MGRKLLRDVVQRVQCIPYSWPGGPTADDVRRYMAGDVRWKHAVLREDLELLGFKVGRLMVVGPLA